MYYAPKQKENRIENFAIQILSLIVALIFLNAKIDKWEEVSIEVRVSTPIPEAVQTASAAEEKTDEGEVLISLPTTSIEQMIRDEFGEEAEIAIAVAKAESGMRPDVIGDTHLSKPSVGLFQISQIYHGYTTEELQDPVKNIKIAKKIRDGRRGWDAWTTFRNKQYLAYIK